MQAPAGDDRQALYILPESPGGGLQGGSEMETVKIHDQGLDFAAHFWSPSFTPRAIASAIFWKVSSSGLGLVKIFT